MPSRNILKIDLPDSHYHVYGRGAGRQNIFREDTDKIVFLNLLKRYLSSEQSKDPLGQPYPNFFGHLKLECFCLMDNHFHMLIYQTEQGYMSSLMRSMLTSYSRYFNKKYNSSGPLLESRYKASMITDDVYLQHITRYIHLNPFSWQTYEFSSLPYYTGRAEADWIAPGEILGLFDGGESYIDFVADYEGNKKMIDEFKHQLAG